MIKPNMPCWVVGPDVPDQYLGMIVETVRYIPEGVVIAANGDLIVASDYWIVKAGKPSPTGLPWGAATRNLQPVFDPEKDYQSRVVAEEAA